jgi:ADP-dependent NAD(P)H-hydrate dehydratase / NAD(P)H-hydrate epimerase
MRPRAPITAEEARAIDRDAAERLCMPTILLMENAARAVADCAATMGARFVVLCGGGNNGGDGLAAARHLGRDRCLVHALAEPDPARAPDAALQLRILRAAGWDVRIGTLPDRTAVGDAVVVDALFGTGLSRPLEGDARRWVESMNAMPGKKLAIDIPSGLHADTGEILGVAFRADVTVTFEAMKVGMTVRDGPMLCGRVEVASLGLP